MGNAFPPPTMNNPAKLPAAALLPRAFAALVAVIAAAAAQQPSLNSHEVNPDHSVTFRCFAPTAQQVTVSLDYDHHPVAMSRGGDGVWSLTTQPLEPALHMYALAVDGTAILDPFNASIDANLVYRANLVSIFGANPQLWDTADVPHGVVHHHAYRSAAIRGLPEGLEDYYVYTPPGYDPAGASRYPVLYLLHGWSQVAESWLSEGRANVILDNLIAQGRARPMVAVMPLGYGDMGFVTGGSGQWNDESRIADNLGRFSDALLSEIVPQVEAGYRVSTDREDRAIAGLSMGGGESLVIGLSHQDMFAWVGGFSSAVLYADLDKTFQAAAQRKGGAPRLLLVACGTHDDLIAANRKFVAWLKAKGLQPTAVETPGIHNWPVWRDNLIGLAPLLFRPGPAPR